MAVSVEEMGGRSEHGERCPHGVRLVASIFGPGACVADVRQERACLELFSKSKSHRPNKLKASEY
jgi:hypothetical protein